MCSFESVADTGRLLHIYNRGYPQSILSSDKICSCSVETRKCGSKINVYLIHFQLDDGGKLCTGKQQVHVYDNGSTHILTCFNNTYYSIEKKMTSAANYLTITLEHEGQINEGYIWIAFEGRHYIILVMTNTLKKAMLHTLRWCIFLIEILFFIVIREVTSVHLFLNFSTNSSQPLQRPPPPRPATHPRKKVQPYDCWPLKPCIWIVRC